MMSLEEGAVFFVVFLIVCGVVQLQTLDDTDDIIVSPHLLCYDINVYVSKTLLSTNDDYKRMRSDIEEILFNARKVYAWHRIELRVLSIVFFNQSDPFELTSDYNDILTQFGLYVANTPEKANAYVLLIDIETSETTVVGRAYLGTACTKSALAVIQAGGALQFNPRSIGYAIAHELGHILNMEHASEDEPGCKCAFENDSCIMRHELFEWKNEQNSPPFHTCSIEALLMEDFECLKKCNPIPNKLDKCGDGVNTNVGSDRTCDCGTKDTCYVRGVSECCDHNTCLLRKNAQCSDEFCCNNCYFTPGKLCRQLVGECDLAEMCTDSHAKCPKDLHMYNGKPCGNNGYCFDGKCSDKNQICQRMFKKSDGVRYSDKCPKIIESYVKIGYCHKNFGNNRSESTELLCQSGENPCGHVWCEMDSINDPFFTVIKMYYGSETVDCYTIDDSAFFAPNGFTCGPSDICYNGKCSPIDDYKTICPLCPQGTVCSDEGSCVAVAVP